MPTALLLDTNSLFFRAHYALPPMNTQSGEPTAALYGFATLLLKLLREERPDGLAFARDLPARTFRHEHYPEYKATRPPMPDALRTQWGRLDALLEALAVPQLTAAGFEADDVLATAAQRLSQVGCAVLIVSGDRDLFQTIGPNVRVLFVGARGQKPVVMDEGAIAARYAVAPEQLPALFALVGEPSDNLIGVSGIGMRTASKLVARHGSVANVLRELDVVTPEKVRDALREAAERITMNEQLARLRVDLPLPEALIAPVSQAAFARLRTLFEALEFKSLAARLDALSLRHP